VVVRRQYASASGLAARASLYANTTGSFAGDVAFEAVAERRPRRFLDVGCGRGWFGARVRDELGADVSAVDQSSRMVELAREAGLDSREPDVRDLPFDDDGLRLRRGEPDAVPPPRWRRGAALRRHVDHVEVHDASGTVTIADRDAILRYLRSAETLAPWVDLLPDHVSPPLVARRSDVVFVADAA